MNVKIGEVGRGCEGVRDGSRGAGGRQMLHVLYSEDQE